MQVSSINSPDRKKKKIKEREQRVSPHLSYTVVVIALVVTSPAEILFHSVIPCSFFSRNVKFFEQIKSANVEDAFSK